MVIRVVGVVRVVGDVGAVRIVGVVGVVEVEVVGQLKMATVMDSHSSGS